MSGQYYIGLEVNPSAVGWAVTDEEYNLCKFRNKDMWGIRLFDDADTAEYRRFQRTIRRRNDRKVQRIKLLQEIFSEEIFKVDKEFFIRLNESFLHGQDKSVSGVFSLFNDKNYTDKDYYKEYPTIYHLRKTLMEDEEKSEDIRLVYLAVHHILKNRGHFLLNGELSAVSDFENTYNTLVDVIADELNIRLSSDSPDEIRKILTDNNTTKANKAKLLEQKLYAELIIEETGEIVPLDDKRRKVVLSNISKFIVGNKGDIAKLTGEHIEQLSKTSFSFAEPNFEEVYEDIEDAAPQWCLLVDALKTLYDWRILVNLLQGEQYLSNAKVKQYDAHKKNLKIVKKIIYKYGGKTAYKTVFHADDQKANYCNYIGSVVSGGKSRPVRKCTKEDFYSYLEKKMKAIEHFISAEDKPLYDQIIDDIENNELLPLQSSKDNLVLPQQLNFVELQKILENAAKKHPFLNAVDEEGLSPIEKIYSIFRFVIPYYVGPLSDRHREDGANNWMIRKEDGYIYPWNFDKKVDLERSNEAFINRMTNKCTYLAGEDVLPKYSLIYSKFSILNELNNLRIRGEKISVELKQQIFNDLFKSYVKVTAEKLFSYLKANGFVIEREDISGIHKDFTASYKAYHDFKKNIFGNDVETPEVQDLIENIIKWITIHGGNKKLLVSMIKKVYPGEFTGDQLKMIQRFSYSGWGNYSRKYLTEIVGANCNTWEMNTILDWMWETNCTLPQLLGSSFTFAHEIEEHNKDLQGEITTLNYESLVKDLYISPSNKRAIWQTVKIVEEIKRIMKKAPARIFIKVYRGLDSNQDGNRKSRKQNLISLYSGCNKPLRDYWLKEIDKYEDEEFNSTKLYLYFLQMGRCLYTGEAIDVDTLMSKDNFGWNKDHIFPRSLFGDDTLDNLVLTKKSVNFEKNRAQLPTSIQIKMRPFWKELLDLGFITKNKFDRLTRTTDFTDEELAGFITNQIMETRQSTKAAADLLKRIYTPYGTDIIYVKAGLVGQFRQQDLHILKSKRVNDFHYAKDAYLNIVVGNVYHEKFTANPLKWIRDNRDNKKEYSINTVFKFDLIKGEKLIWEGLHKGNAGTIAKIRKTVRQNNVLYTERTYCEHGELFDMTIYPANDNIKVGVKNHLDTSKYGGYKSVKTSYFALIEYDGKKERIKTLVGIPIYISNILDQNPNALSEYLKQRNFKNVVILKEKIKKNALMIIDGFPLRIRGENDLQIIVKSNVQLVTDQRNEETIRRIEKYIEKSFSSGVGDIDTLKDEYMVDLYDMFITKLQNSIFAKRPNNISEKLIAGRGKFIRLNKKDKIKVLNEILILFRCDTSSKADLTLIGASKYTGNLAKNKNALSKSTITLVNKSVTGLFENREEL